MTSVEVESLVVRRDGHELVRGVDLVVTSGTVLALLGASGSGKTTVLRAVAGLEPVAVGAVRFGGVDVTALPAADRNVGMVFQQPVLYPRRTVGRNISFPLELRHDPIEEIRKRVGAESRALHIEALLAMPPARLSAGEAQVVQIARAMVRSPEVLLLDEPFALLDPVRAAELRREVLTVQRGLGITTIVATNDAADAMTLADRVAVIDGGRITLDASPLAVYDRPRTAAAALMTGEADVIEVRVVVDDAPGAWLEHPGFRLRAWPPALRRHDGRRLQMIVRPEWWQRDDRGPVVATVERVLRLGSTVSLRCLVGGRRLTVKLSDRAGDEVGDRIGLRLDRWVLLDPLDGFALELDG
jgi:ABC-type sugar transport system ATPase subunit